MYTTLSPSYLPVGKLNWSPGYGVRIFNAHYSPPSFPPLLTHIFSYYRYSNHDRDHEMQPFALLSTTATSRTRPHGNAWKQFQVTLSAISAEHTHITWAQSRRLDLWKLMDMEAVRITTIPTTSRTRPGSAATWVACTRNITHAHLRIA